MKFLRMLDPRTYFVFPRQTEREEKPQTKYPKYILAIEAIVRKRQERMKKATADNDYVDSKNDADNWFTNKLSMETVNLKEKYRDYKAFKNKQKYQAYVKKTKRAIKNYGILYSRKIEKVKVAMLKEVENRPGYDDSQKKWQKEYLERQTYVYEVWGPKKAYMRDIIAVQKHLSTGLQK